MTSSDERIAALIRQVDIHPPTRHLIGLPSELDGDSERVEMSWPSMVLVEKRSDGVFLDRYTSVGHPVGDTWHLSAEDAVHQANTEYPGMIGNWTIVPAELAIEELYDYLNARRL
jgi:hypothetical protein